MHGTDQTKIELRGLLRQVAYFVLPTRVRRVNVSVESTSSSSYNSTRHFHVLLLPLSVHYPLHVEVLEF